MSKIVISTSDGDIDVKPFMTVNKTSSVPEDVKLPEIDDGMFDEEEE